MKSEPSMSDHVVLQELTRCGVCLPSPCSAHTRLCIYTGRQCILYLHGLAVGSSGSGSESAACCLGSRPRCCLKLLLRPGCTGQGCGASR